MSTITYLHLSTTSINRHSAFLLWGVLHINEAIEIMYQVFYYSLFVNNGPWPPMDHSENNLIFTDHLFKLFTVLQAFHILVCQCLNWLFITLGKLIKTLLNTKKILAGAILFSQFCWKCENRQSLQKENVNWT